MWRRFSHVIEHIDTEAGALERAAQWVSSRYERPFVVSDRNTRAAAGQAFLGMLGNADVLEHCFSDRLLLADEFALGRLTAAFQASRDVIVAVGSGTLGDLCKFLAVRTGRPVVVVATAPSMDGYASASSAMTLHNLKITPRTQAPQALFCDPEILKDAPMHMIAAGVGDILGKITSLADWKLAHLLNGDRYDAEIAALVETALQKCMDSAAMLKSRSVEVTRNIIEALVMSGIAMSLYGDSRPASGTEHHLAHYWELRFLLEGRPPVLHGTKVGVATVCALTLWQYLPALPEAPGKEDRAAVLAKVKSMYGASSNDIIKTENPNLDFEKLLQNWPHIKKIAGDLPQAGDIAAVLTGMDAPCAPPGIGLDRKTLTDSVLLARERKKTYTLLQLLGDLGLLGAYAERLANDPGMR